MHTFCFTLKPNSSGKATNSYLQHHALCMPRGLKNNLLRAQIFLLSQLKKQSTCIDDNQMSVGVKDVFLMNINL